MAPTPVQHHPPFQPFFAAQRGAVLRLLVGMVGPDDAEDCFQETFLKALRAWPPRDARGRLDSWVLTIAHRTALDLLRARGREVATGELPEQPVVDEDDRVLAALDADELWRAVAGLSPMQRATIVLRAVLDFSHARSAEVLATSEDAARRSYADGIHALRGLVDRNELEAGR
ncbi:MAG: sigma-70 family polymerase sigma factor [Thermoleophilia bacterium]|nr:sigma-70 family polymerase sigma factor [Thermoleophilia bacterium]